MATHYFQLGEIVFALRAEPATDYSAWKSTWVVETWAKNPKPVARIKELPLATDGDCGDPWLAVLAYCKRFPKHEYLGVVNQHANRAKARSSSLTAIIKKAALRAKVWRAVFR